MIELQTMPLRFRVWDKVAQAFVAADRVGPQGWPCLFDHNLACFAIDEDERFIISQDTGLKDMDGESIYTGDIVEKRYHNENVFGSLGGVRAVCVYDDNAEVEFELVLGSDNVKGFIQEYAIIGNVWQTPELLEAE